MKLLYGDCLRIMPRLDADCVDMVLADLPYGTTRNSWDSVIDLENLWTQYRRLVRPGAAIVLFAASPFDKVLACSNLPQYRYEWVWEKTNATGHLNAKRMPMRAHENILVFYDKLPTYNPQMTHGHERKVSTAAHKRNSKATTNWGPHGLTTYDSTSRYPRDVLRFASDKQTSKLHPTQKPVALLKYLIATYTNVGDTVLDNTMGSGSTGVAAVNLGREFIGIENNQDYFQTATARIGRACAG